MSFKDLRPSDVREAMRTIEPVVKHTALRRSHALSRAVGGDVFLKLENRQVTGSFKFRGAYNAIASLPADVRQRGVVAASAGNHGLGIARSAQHFGIRATIFVPGSAPRVKREGIIALGAIVDSTAGNYDLALEAAQAFARTHNSTFINACLGDTLIAGQGTVALEILEDLPDVASVIVPVGGGGLLGGVGSLLRHEAPHVRILGAQSDATSAMAQSLHGRMLVSIPDLPTLAEGLAGQIDDEALDIGIHALDDIALVTEDDIGRAISWLARQEGETVEGSGAVGVAAMRSGRFTSVPTPAAIVVSGGNIDPERHEQLLRDYLV